MQNPLLEKTAFPVFSNIKPKHIVPALEQILSQNRIAIKKLLAQKKPFIWQNLMQPLEELDDRLHVMWAKIEHLHYVVDSKSLRSAYNTSLPKLYSYLIEIAQNVKLYKAIQSIAENKVQYKKLDISQKKIITNILRDFKLSGIALKPKAKRHFAKLQKSLSQLSNKFSENVLDATQSWAHDVTDKNELKGIPSHAIKLARETARQKNLNGWLFTLQQPSYLAVMTYADTPQLREKMYQAYVTRASDEGPNANKWNNSSVMNGILKRREELASLLNFDNYAEYSLVPKTAKYPKQVIVFLNKLARYTKHKAEQEYKELQQFADQKFNVSNLQPWDIAYYSEKLKQHEFALSAEDLRPYFPEPQVLSGMFKLAKRLFNITIEQVNNVDIWHQDVKVFNIYDQSKNLRSRFYLDLYARQNKQSGAWMKDYQTRRFLNDGEIQVPVAFIICNFNRPVGGTPALFTHNDVITLFHEFGHSLQHMLTTINYAGVSGINGIPWDAVELASQFMENWCWQKPVLNLIAKHYKTGKPLPKKLFDKMLAAKKFQSGLQMLRQLEFALFDFHLHLEFDPKKKNQIQNILNEVRRKNSVLPYVKYNRFQHSFTHIFSGGYAAGYYSYKWAEVLSSDMFEKFEEDGFFNKTTCESFLHNILEPGGSIDPMILFKRFRGRAPKIDALLEHYDIVKP
jgi:oligopeptidase A